jgi:hypothetical protein
MPHPRLWFAPSGVYIANQLQARHDDDEGIAQLVDQPLVSCGPALAAAGGCWAGRWFAGSCPVHTSGRGACTSRPPPTPPTQPLGASATSFLWCACAPTGAAAAAAAAAAGPASAPAQARWGAFAAGGDQGHLQRRRAVEERQAPLALQPQVLRPLQRPGRLLPSPARPQQLVLRGRAVPSHLLAPRSARHHHGLRCAPSPCRALACARPLCWQRTAAAMPPRPPPLLPAGSERLRGWRLRLPFGLGSWPARAGHAHLWVQPSSQDRTGQAAQRSSGPPGLGAPR